MSETSREGISIRFIRQYDVKVDRAPDYVDHAMWLASTDERDLAFNEKLDDALRFLRERLAATKPT